MTGSETGWLVDIQGLASRWTSLWRRAGLAVCVVCGVARSSSPKGCAARGIIWPPGVVVEDPMCPDSSPGREVALWLAKARRTIHRGRRWGCNGVVQLATRQTRHSYNLGPAAGLPAGPMCRKATQHEPSAVDPSGWVGNARRRLGGGSTQGRLDGGPISKQETSTAPAGSWGTRLPSLRGRGPRDAGPRPQHDVFETPFHVRLADGGPR